MNVIELYDLAVWYKRYFNDLNGRYNDLLKRLQQRWFGLFEQFRAVL